MTIEELCAEMEHINKEWPDDEGRAHDLMDTLLLKYIGSEEVTRLFKVLPKWTE